MLVARTVGGLEEVDDEIKALGGAATLVPLDVTDGPGIDRLGAALYERFGRLDVLLGNAGILGTLSPIGHIEPDVFERVMAVNVTANWRLIRSLDPLLRRSDAGRAIFVTSGISRKRRALLGRLCRQQGGAGHAGRHLCRRGRAHRRARQPVQSRARSAPPCAARPSRARIPAKQTPPEAHAEALIRLALPSCTMNGQWVAGDEALAALDRRLSGLRVAARRGALHLMRFDRPVDAELQGGGSLPSARSSDRWRSPPREVLAHARLEGRHFVGIAGLRQGPLRSWR